MKKSESTVKKIAAKVVTTVTTGDKESKKQKRKKEVNDAKKDVLQSLEKIVNKKRKLDDEELIELPVSEAKDLGKKVVAAEEPQEVVASEKEATVEQESPTEHVSESSITSCNQSVDNDDAVAAWKANHESRKAERIRLFKEKCAAKGREVRNVNFAEEFVSVRHIATYKRWNYRQYAFVCSHLSYFAGEQEGFEDEIVEEVYENIPEPMD